jgi:hypothetical protein
MKTYIFFRDIGWYALQLKDDAEAVANAKCNPGTTKVEDSDGNVIWTAPKATSQ